MKETEKAYYEKRAPEYDDWYLGTGLYAARERPGWDTELAELSDVLCALPFRSILDVACGTGFLTRYLPGRVIALDQSPSMLKIARTRFAGGLVVQGDAFNLPFPSQTFECLLTGHFYGHLDSARRTLFLRECRRVAGNVLVIDAALRPEVAPEEMQERQLNDGSRHTVYKRYFAPVQLVEELSGGTVLHAGRWFVAVCS
jgi:demethylmenaquinone methyltransferase/2-methoxy-6-polyprenyl-1,4-benzoquinol methylase